MTKLLLVSRTSFERRTWLCGGSLPLYLLSSQTQALLGQGCFLTQVTCLSFGKICPLPLPVGSEVCKQYRAFLQGFRPLLCFEIGSQVSRLASNSMCGQRGPCTSDPLASTSWVLRAHVCIVTPGLCGGEYQPRLSTSQAGRCSTTGLPSASATAISSPVLCSTPGTHGCFLKLL